MEKVIVVYDSKFVIDVVSAIEQQGTYAVFGLISTREHRITSLLKHSLLGVIDELQMICEEHQLFNIVLAIEEPKLKRAIAKTLAKCIKLVRFVNVVHPSAVIGKNTILKKGVIILANAIVNGDSRVGKFCIIKEQSSLGHEGRMGNYSTLEHSVSTGGNCKLGKYSVISASANIIENISIGKNSVVNFGALVLKDVSNNTQVGGIPARVKL